MQCPAATCEEDQPDQEDAVSLVRAAQRGDRQAFGRLAVRFEALVYTTAMRRLGNHAEAQELCQEVLLKAMQRIDQLKTPEALGGWLRSITVRMAINRQTRSAPPLSAEPEVLEGTCIESETPLDAMLSRERRGQVRAGLGRLGDLDRATLDAFYFQGRSLLEMSDDFHSPVGTIKRRLHVARQRLAKELADLSC